MLATLEVDDSLFRVPDAIDMTEQLKGAVENLRMPRVAVDMRVPPPYNPQFLPPSHYVAEAIKALPRTG